MSELPEYAKIPLDAPLTEVWCVENGRRQRVYRGRTQAHIEWKLHEHRKNQKRGSHAPEIIEIDEVPA